MIQPNSLLPSLDKDAERRRALGKVYSLLIRLAEEADTQIMHTNTDSKEKIEEPVPSEADQLNKEINVCCDSEFLNTEAQPKDNSVPLQKNIPPTEV